MLRRLLTCLALITGLAAAGAPANAAVMDVLSEHVSASSASCHIGQSAPIECATQPACSPTKGDRVTDCEASKPVAIIIPTIYIGVDRAYE